MPELSVAELARHVGGEAVGDLTRRLRAVASLDTATEHDLSLVANRKYLPYVGATRAGAVLVSRELVDALPPGITQIRVADAHVALRQVLMLLHPPPPHVPGIHPTAIFGADAEVGADVAIGPYAVIGRGVRLGARVQIGAHVVIGDGCEVGADTVLHPHVTLYPGVQVGERCILHSGVRLGGDGFGYAFVEGEHRKVPQVGGCRIGDDVEIGANTTIDRGSIGDTVVGRGTKIDNLVHLGHNVRVGEHVIVVAQVGVSGSSSVGDYAVLGGQVGVAGHLSIGERARLGAQAGVTTDVPAGETYSGYPARPHAEALRAQAALFRLPALLRRIRELEQRLAAVGGATTNDYQDSD